MTIDERQARNRAYQRKYLSNALNRKKKRLRDRKRYNDNPKAKIMKNSEWRRQQYFTPKGHALAIYVSIKKYADQWKLPVASKDQFLKWAMSDPSYDALFKAWEAGSFSKNGSPVAMRKAKKNGFVIANLHWDHKKRFHFWNEDMDLIKAVHKDLERYRDQVNKGTKEGKKKGIERTRFLLQLQKEMAAKNAK